MEMSNKMRFYGEKMTDVTIVEKILGSMTPKYDYVVCSIEESKDIDELSLDELQSSLLVHEQKMNRKEGVEVEEDEKEIEDIEMKATNMAIKISEPIMTTTKAEGEILTNPRLPNEKEEKSNFAENKEGETLLMAVHAGNELEKQLIWYVDTGCSNHMTGSKSSFTVLNENFRSTVSFGDLSTVNVMGKEKGYVITLRNDACEISDPSKGVIAFVKMSQNRLFPLKIENDQSCYMAEVRNPSWLWHFRYGHLGFGGLRTLQQKKMVIGIPEIITHSQVCEECVVGKQHRSQFPKGKSWRANSVLELVHSDICGPINPISNGGKKYFITFIDDYSRKTWVYILQEKSEAFNVFKSFKAHVENETRKIIKNLQTDS
ncbi:uncharacterized protein LOC125810676 [Solanum verrucosum]|uniref:uncharacterized protein LOC125810676 n=1 Tax=Solanum verrucosum TaxID=315347 RepID=UPI0020D0C2E1|nr:uncharacterized protein LOC125810676 [Solanum verrucosum]